MVIKRLKDRYAARDRCEKNYRADKFRARQIYV